MTLSTLQTLLENKGYDTSLSDSLQASKEAGNRAVNISVDSGGGCLVVVKRKQNVPKQSFKYKSRSIPIVCETYETKTFRVQLDSTTDFDMIEKEINGE